MRRRATAAFAVLLFTLAVAALACHAKSYWPFFADDSFISLRYSERLLHGQGLTWTDGEHVEGYSNFLWVVLVAAFGVVNGDLVWVARGVGLACMALTQAALFRGCLRKGGLWPVMAAGFSALALAACGPVAAWATGGLEQPLLAALLAWSYVLCSELCAQERDPPGRALLPVSLLLGLLCLVRPDGVLFSAAAGLGWFVARGVRRASVRAVGTLAIGPIALTAAQLAFRRLYYQSWVPNTYYAKGTFSWSRVHAGIDYIEGSLHPLGALWAIVAVATLVALLDRPARARMAVPLLGSYVWAAYVVRIGGDIISQRRHLVPLLVLAAVLLLQLLRRSAQAQWSVDRVAAWLIGPLVLAGLVIGQRDDPARARALADTWNWSGQPVGLMLRAAFAAQRPLLAVDAAGTLPYYYRLPCLDMLGLNDRYLATHPPPDLGSGYIGHELGNGAYVLSRKPDIIAFWTPLGGPRTPWRSGRELLRMPEFRSLYRMVTLETPRPKRVRSRLWVRTRDSRIGVQVQPDRVVIPAYTMYGDSRAVVRIDSSSRPYVSASSTSTLRAYDVPVGPGTWRVSVDAKGSPRLTVRCRGSARMLASGATFERKNARDTISVELRAPEGRRLAVRQVVLERTR